MLDQGKKTKGLLIKVISILSIITLLWISTVYISYREDADLGAQYRFIDRLYIKNGSKRVLLPGASDPFCYCILNFNTQDNYYALIKSRKTVGGYNDSTGNFENKSVLYTTDNKYYSNYLYTALYYESGLLTVAFDKKYNAILLSNTNDPISGLKIYENKINKLRTGNFDVSHISAVELSEIVHFHLFNIFGNRYRDDPYFLPPNSSSIRNGIIDNLKKGQDEYLKTISRDNFKNLISFMNSNDSGDTVKIMVTQKFKTKLSRHFKVAMKFDSNGNLTVTGEEIR